MEICKKCIHLAGISLDDVSFCNVCTRGSLADIGSSIFVIYEENHGAVIHAATRQKAIQALIDTDWINGFCELWDYDKQKGERIKDLFPDWRDWLLNTATDLDFDNMSYNIREEIFFR